MALVGSPGRSRTRTKTTTRMTRKVGMSCSRRRRMKEASGKSNAPCHEPSGRWTGPGLPVRRQRLFIEPGAAENIVAERNLDKALHMILQRHRVGRLIERNGRPFGVEDLLNAGILHRPLGPVGFLLRRFEELIRFDVLPA